LYNKKFKLSNNEARLFVAARVYT